MDLAPRVPVQTTVEAMPLEQANEALDRLRGGRLTGALALVPVGAQPLEQLQQRGLHLVPRGPRLRRVGDHHRRLAHRRQQQVGERAAPAARAARRPPSRACSPAVTSPMPWRMSISRHSAQPSTEGASSRFTRACAGSMHASRKARVPVFSSSRASVDAVQAARDRGHDLALHLLVHRPEQVALVGEVVVERPAGHLRAADDLLGAHGGVSALGEQLAGSLHQRGARGLRTLLLRWLIQVYVTLPIGPYNLYVKGAQHAVQGNLAVTRPRRAKGPRPSRWEADRLLRGRARARRSCSSTACW